MKSLEYSKDYLLNISKKREGYRYSIDPFLISGFTDIDGCRLIADLGTGSGIIPILLARRSFNLSIIGLEIQWSLAKEARKNIKKNSLSDRIKIVCCDINKAASTFAPECLDLIIGNPPYRRKNDGKINPEEEKAIARHEIKITLSQYIKASKHLVRDRGRVTIIYHPYRLAELLSIMLKERITPVRIRCVHSNQRSLARMVMVEGIKNGKNDLTVINPLFVYDEDNNYSQEMQEIYNTSGFPIQNKYP